MCNECHGYTETCPVCGRGDEDYDDLDDQLDHADDWYNEEKLREHDTDN